MSGSPQLQLRGVYREFPSGGDVVVALRDIHLSIHAGEMVAIVGASGSGKSTLMNILGCLDRPTRGVYRVGGSSTETLGANDLARLRRDYFGFVFQRYHLLSALNALGNVEVPAIYAGLPRRARHTRARALLQRLGLNDRGDHRPNQLSGGQQQRVSIARALVNDPEIILADEPTGALDSRSGEEVIAILRELHAEGRTIVLVTHDVHVAAHADRIVEIADGVIVSDRLTGQASVPARRAVVTPARQRLGAVTGQFVEAFWMALMAIAAHRLRTFLTMLGIVIGIASVVSVVAIGEGSRRRVLDSISDMGTNTIDIWVGEGWGDTRASRLASLQPDDADALAREPYIASASPTVLTTLRVRRRNLVATADIVGVSEQYFNVRGIRITDGVAFDAESVRRRAQEVVIDRKTKATLFADGVNPLGAVILLGNLPVRIVGVAEPGPTMPGGQNPTVFAPYSTVSGRITGQRRIDSVMVRVKDGVSSGAAEHAVTRLLASRRGTSDFFIQNSDAIRKTMEATAVTMSLLISAVAIISLIVGGIGVMNIMLVSVTERTSEIGVRLAVGAQPHNILTQFLIEAVMICLIGGFLGVLMALGVGPVLRQFTTAFSLVYSVTSIVAACACSTAIGLAFGYLPARHAARLDPVQALARE